MVSERTLANASTDSMSIIKDSASSAAFHLPAQVISIKLDGTNFLAWSAQLLPLFRSYGLMGIVDGSEPSPPQFSSPENQAQGIRDSGYVIWQYKDQTILGWIISSLSPEVVSTIYGLETSRLAWQALGARFVAPSTSRISLIKRKLQSLQQGSMQCQQFLDAVKSLADELSAVGKPIDDSDLILSVLNGLNSSFHSFITTYMLLAKEKSMSFSDFHAELLNFDLMQKFHSQTIQQETGSYAFYSHKPGSRSNFRAHDHSIFTGPDSCVDSSGMTNTQPLSFSPPSFNFLPATSTATVSISSPTSNHGTSSEIRAQSVPSPRHPDQEIIPRPPIPSNSIAPPVVIDSPCPNSSTGIITRSKTGNSKPRAFTDFQLNYTTRHPL
ncbi:hypothetical protein DKX38_026214 [Salix brachista]|uniref:Retrotransposon Copia-like N-terminal domain-containing protein n=1 Tax=Salix brachista TaxID=2182728 RepID=A0A5N5JWY8_9ROSI|nr:hypothetical protein DKX38_026214 [Salix brachista]